MSNILSSVTFNLCKYCREHHLDQDVASRTLMTQSDKDVTNVDTHSLEQNTSQGNALLETQQFNKGQYIKASCQECKVGLTLKMNNVNHHVSRLENHMIISIDTDKTIDKIQHPFMIKKTQTNLYLSI